MKKVMIVALAVLLLILPVQPAVQNAFCMQCGAPLSPGAPFCTKCGKKTRI